MKSMCLVNYFLTLHLRPAIRPTTPPIGVLQWIISIFHFYNLYNLMISFYIFKFSGFL